jgi:hypothetical protein
MSAPEIPDNCPQCGAGKAASDYATAYRCGTLVSSSGRLYHTGTCRSFSELRKPLDEERNQLAERVKRLEEAADAMADAYEQIIFDRYDSNVLANYKSVRSEP